MFASIPLSALFSVEHVFQDVWAQEELEALSDTEATAVYLAHLRSTRGVAAGDNAAWDPYIQLLPDSFPTSPLFFDDAQLALLQRSQLRSFVSRRLSRANATWSGLSAAVREVVSYPDFLWGLSVLWSRVHGVRVKDSEGKWHKASAFVPVADLLNSASGPRSSSSSGSGTGGISGEGETPNCDCHTNDASTHFECYVTRLVRRGEELLVPYGAPSSSSSSGSTSASPSGLGNGQLLLDYGFAIEHNRNDVLHFDLAPLRSVGSYPSEGQDAAPTVTDITPAVFELQRSLMRTVLRRDAGEARSYAFQLHYPPSTERELSSVLPVGLLQLLRIQALDSTFHRRFGADPAGLAKHLEQDLPLSPSHEAAALHMLQAQLLTLLSSYDTSIHDDALLLAGLPSPEDIADLPEQDLEAPTPTRNDIQRQRFCIFLRMGEKSIIYLYANMIAKHLQGLVSCKTHTRRRQRRRY